MLGTSLAYFTFISLLCACLWDSFAMSQKRCALNETSGFLNCSYRGVSRSIVLLNEKLTETVSSIDFSGNKINEIEQLHRYPNVISLSFESNSISRIRNDTFVNVTKLENLDLSINNIRTIEPFLFSANKHLRKLSLRGNSLRFSPSTPLLCSASIQVLDLSSCGIVSLTKENLMCLPSVVSVDLNFNSIAALSPLAFSFTPSLSSLLLRNNDFRCDCALVTLVAWLRSKTTDLSLSDPTCILPPANATTLRKVKDEKRLSDCDVTDSLVSTATPEVQSKATPEVQSRVTPKVQSKATRSRNDSGPEVDYILILDFRVPNEEEEVEVEVEDPNVVGEARLVSEDVFWTQTIAPIVLLVLVVAVCVMIHRLLRPAASGRRESDNGSMSSNDSIRGLIPTYKEEHTYVQVK